MRSASVNRDLALTFRPLSDQIGASLTQERIVAMLSGFFGGLALLLAGPRPLRRDVVRGVAPPDRDRHPHGARRGAGRRRAAGAVARLAARRPRRRGRRRPQPLGGAVRVDAALRPRAARSGDARRRPSRCSPRSARSPDGCRRAARRGSTRRKFCATVSACAPLRYSSRAAWPRLWRASKCRRLSSKRRRASCRSTWSSTTKTENRSPILPPPISPVFEDGKEQKVELFQVNVARPSGAIATPVGAGGAFGANLFTNRPNAAVPLTATVVLFDRLNTRFEDQAQARAEMVKFLGQVKTDERVALYVLESNAIRVLHDFSRDSQSLVRAIARYGPQTSIEQQAADAPPPPSSPTGVAGVDAETEAWLQQTTQMVANEFLRRRAQNALAALETIGHHLAGIPGRKNVVWISSAFPLNFTDTVGTAPGAPSVATTFSGPLMRAQTRSAEPMSRSIPWIPAGRCCTPEWRRCPRQSASDARRRRS